MQKLIQYITIEPFLSAMLVWERTILQKPYLGYELTIHIFLLNFMIITIFPMGTISNISGKG